MNGRVELISQAEYARRRGVAKSAVAKAVKEKRITLIDGKIDPAVADIQWSQNTRARGDSGRSTAQTGSVMVEQGVQSENAPGAAESAGAKSAQPADDYQALRARREAAAVEAAERDNAREAGRLVDRADISRGVFDAFRAVRDSVMASPQRSTQRGCGQARPRPVHRAIRA